MTTATVMRRYARAALPPNRCSTLSRNGLNLMVSSEVPLPRLRALLIDVTPVNGSSSGSISVLT